MFIYKSEDDLKVNLSLERQPESLRKDFQIDWIQLFQASVRMWDNWRGNFLKIVEWLLLLFVLEFGWLFHLLSERPKLVISWGCCVSQLHAHVSQDGETLQWHQDQDQEQTMEPVQVGGWIFLWVLQVQKEEILCYKESSASDLFSIVVDFIAIHPNQPPPPSNHHHHSCLLINCSLRAEQVIKRNFHWLHSQWLISLIIIKAWATSCFTPVRFLI